MWLKKKVTLREWKDGEAQRTRTAVTGVIVSKNGLRESLLLSNDLTADGVTFYAYSVTPSFLEPDLRELGFEPTERPADLDGLGLELGNQELLEHLVKTG